MTRARERAGQSARERFGGDLSWPLPDGGIANVGHVITGEGPGEGFTMLPWAMDRYERVMRLRPGETWLLKRLIKHAWRSNGECFISQKKLEREADVTRKTVRCWFERLEKLNFVERLPQPEGDGRHHYALDGFYAALSLCILADPKSKFSQERGTYLDWEQAMLTGFHQRSGKWVRFDLDFHALADLSGATDYQDDDEGGGVIFTQGWVNSTQGVGSFYPP
jgi:hypothetical protein